MKKITVTRKTGIASIDLKTALLRQGVIEHPNTDKISFSILRWYEIGKRGVCVSTDALEAIKRYPACELNLSEDGYVDYVATKARKDELVLIKKGSASSRKGLRKFTFALKGRTGSETVVTAKSEGEAATKVAAYPHHYSLGRHIATYEIERFNS